jgi:hypothetical protein
MINQHNSSKGMARKHQTYSNDIHKRSFPSILEPNQGKLHLLLEKEAVDTKIANT